MLDTIVPADENRVSFAQDVDRDAAVERAAAIFLREGVVVLDDLVDPALIAACKAEVDAKYPDMTVVDTDRNFGLFDGRHTMPIRVEGLVADSAILVPRVVDAIAQRLLGPKYQVDSVGLLVSLPGADDQVVHRDETLFPGTVVDRLLPPFAIAFSLPLVPMDEVSGTTAFWRRSHRQPDVPTEHDYAPIVQPGSALLWDYRLTHCGLANRGDHPRPIIFSALCRDWWSQFVRIDATRYEKLLLSRTVYETMKPRWKRMFGRATLID